MYIQVDYQMFVEQFRAYDRMGNFSHHALRISAKLARLANMKASYKFRLAAMVATDNRPGKLWA